jgi:hypothetical protein
VALDLSHSEWAGADAPNRSLKLVVSAGRDLSESDRTGTTHKRRPACGLVAPIGPGPTAAPRDPIDLGRPMCPMGPEGGGARRDPSAPDLAAPVSGKTQRRWCVRARLTVFSGSGVAFHGFKF